LSLFERQAAASAPVDIDPLDTPSIQLSYGRMDPGGLSPDPPIGVVGGVNRVAAMRLVARVGSVCRVIGAQQAL
jgi:hypothetical protein